MDAVTRDFPAFCPVRLELDVNMDAIRFAFGRVVTLQLAEFNATGIDQTEASCIRHFYRNDLLHPEDPYLYSLLERTGKELLDVMIFGFDSITQRCLSYLPNLISLRLYYPHPTAPHFIPRLNCCKFLVTVECVGPSVAPDAVVTALTNCGHTALRALALYCCKYDWTSRQTRFIANLGT